MILVSNLDWSGCRFDFDHGCFPQVSYLSAITRQIGYKYEKILPRLINGYHKGCRQFSWVKNRTASWAAALRYQGMKRFLRHWKILVFEVFMGLLVFFSFQVKRYFRTTFGDFIRGVPKIIICKNAAKWNRRRKVVKGRKGNTGGHRGSNEMTQIWEKHQKYFVHFAKKNERKRKLAETIRKIGTTNAFNPKFSEVLSALGGCVFPNAVIFFFEVVSFKTPLMLTQN